MVEETSALIVNKTLLASSTLQALSAQLLLKDMNVLAILRALSLGRRRQVVEGAGPEAKLFV